MKMQLKSNEFTVSIALEKDSVVDGVFNLKVDDNIAMIISLNPLTHAVEGEVLDAQGNRSLVVSLDDGHLIHNVRNAK